MGPREPSPDPEPNPLAADPRVSHELLTRLLSASPAREGLSQTERRNIVEHACGWLEATAMTLARAGMRLSWRVDNMPVRWLPSELGEPYSLDRYISPFGWAPLGQVYGYPPPTERIEFEPQYVYPPHSADHAYVKWYRDTVEYWDKYWGGEERRERRRRQYAERRAKELAAEAGESAVCFQDAELVSVEARSLAWVRRGETLTQPIQLTRLASLPRDLHPCGVLSDFFYDPRRPEGPPVFAPWPPLGVHQLRMPPVLQCVVPSAQTSAQERLVAAATGQGEPGLVPAAQIEDLPSESQPKRSLRLRSLASTPSPVVDVEEELRSKRKRRLSKPLFPSTKASPKTPAPSVPPAPIVPGEVGAVEELPRPSSPVLPPPWSGRAQEPPRQLEPSPEVAVVAAVPPAAVVPPSGEVPPSQLGKLTSLWILR